MEKKNILGAATFLFLLGYVIGTGKFKKVARSGTTILSDLGLLALDKLTRETKESAA